MFKVSLVFYHTHYSEKLILNTIRKNGTWLLLKNSNCHRNDNFLYFLIDIKCIPDMFRVTSDWCSIEVSDRAFPDTKFVSDEEDEGCYKRGRKKFKTSRFVMRSESESDCF